MTNDLNFTIVRIEESAVCDLTQKTGEAAVCVLPGDMEVVVSTAKLLEMIRFEARKLSRKNGTSTKSGAKTGKATAND